MNKVFMWIISLFKKKREPGIFETEEYYDVAGDLERKTDKFTGIANCNKIWRQGLR